MCELTLDEGGHCEGEDKREEHAGGRRYGELDAGGRREVGGLTEEGHLQLGYRDTGSYTIATLYN